jgi:hypothetical protein
MNIILIILTSLVILLCLTPAGFAVTFTVNSSSDSHDSTPGDGICDDGLNLINSGCSLRAALDEANALEGSDTILIPGTVSPIRLSLGSLVCSDDATVIVGLDSYPIIDGTDNPFASHILRLSSDRNLVTGLTIRRARYHGILIEGADNVIGGESESERNLFVSNGLDSPDGAGVAVEGSLAMNNRIVGNFIGIAGNGTLLKPNRNGLRLAVNSGYSRVDRNLISGNELSGVVITGGSHDNKLTYNIIGPNITGSSGPGNGADGILIIENANDNQIGGDLVTERNLISLNSGNGICISASHRNTVHGNHIGLDDFGRASIGNRLAGIRIADAATNNRIGGSTPETKNLISGNMGDGIVISGSGTTENVITGNHIGVDIVGIRPRGNGFPYGHGIRVDSGATDNLIGRANEGEGNTISGNHNCGVYLSGSGTHDNRIENNHIGVNVYGSSSVPNGTGVAIRNGAHGNTVGGRTLAEGNLISGNRADIFPFGCGVLISDGATEENVVSGNYIGLDITGTRALRNGSAGVIIANGASYNTVGGETEGERNVISGNGTGSFVSGLGRGVHLTSTETAYNRIIGNYIGTGVDGRAVVENTGHGIAVQAGAHHNEFGGNSPETGNLIARNSAHGILIQGKDSRNNLIRYNSMFDNDSLGIAIRDGAQLGVRPPIILAAGDGAVSGSGAPPGGQVDIYRVAPDPSDRGEGMALIGSGIVDDFGIFTFAIAGIVTGDTLTAISSDKENNSSEFSSNFEVGSITSVVKSDDEIPTDYQLAQNYPNPFNPETVIPFYLPRTTEINLSIYNVLGQKVKTLYQSRLSAGAYTAVWDGMDSNGNRVTSGVYFSRMTAKDFTAVRKLLLLK